MRSYAAVLFDWVHRFTNMVSMNGEEKKKSKGKKGVVFKVCREVAGITLWAFVAVQVLVFDLYGAFKELTDLPDWISQFRGVIFLTFVVIAWGVLGNKTFFQIFGYIVFYPAVVLFWHLPKALCKNITLVVVFSPAIYSFVTSFRSIFIIYSLAIISASVIAFAENQILVVGAMVILGLVLIAHYYRQIMTVFASKTVFSSMGRAVTAMWEATQESKAFMPPEGIDPDTKEGKKKFGADLFGSYLITAGLGKVAKKMQEIAEGRKIDLYLALSFFLTVVFTVVVFGFLYLGLDQIYPESFDGEPGVFSFIGYSMCVLTTSSLSGIAPQSTPAVLLSYGELIGTISISILMVFLIMTSLRGRYRSDLEKVTNELVEKAHGFEDLLLENYDLSIQAAEEFLLAYQRDVAAWVLRIRHDKDGIAKLQESVQKRMEDGHEFPITALSKERSGLGGGAALEVEIEDVKEDEESEKEAGNSMELESES